jgi:2-haloacid dehalogenase
MSVRWVLFDMNGTLLDPAGIGEPLGLPGELSVALLDETILLAMAETLSGGDRAFPELLGGTLRRRAELGGSGEEAVAEAMERAAAMPPYPDAAAAIERLRDAGLHVGVLTNTPTPNAEAALRAAGLRDALELVVGSDETGAFKPHPRVYARGVERTGAAAREVCMTATHGWDLLGAHRAGMRTAWVRRKEIARYPTNPSPDFEGDGLLEVAEAVAGAV